MKLGTIKTLLSSLIFSIILEDELTSFSRLFLNNQSIVDPTEKTPPSIVYSIPLFNSQAIKIGNKPSGSSISLPVLISMNAPVP